MLNARKQSRVSSTWPSLRSINNASQNTILHHHRIRLTSIFISTTIFQHYDCAAGLLKQPQSKPNFNALKTRLYEHFIIKQATPILWSRFHQPSWWNLFLLQIPSQQPIQGLVQTWLDREFLRVEPVRANATKLALANYCRWAGLYCTFESQCSIYCVFACPQLVVSFDVEKVFESEFHSLRMLKHHKNT